MKLLLAALLVVAIGAPTLTGADIVPPSSWCRAPTKPYQFTSEWELQSYKDEAARFERCIDAFVSEQQEAARAHKQAANDAIEKWNRFARTL